ncbi:NYN domain-containing protein [Caballeronia sp. LP006]|uniref:NYN domain-containing protein n=1 Tax=Caballeronia sp. LP006 TaxID=3038552 RepID=UPI0028671BB6|nr:NYN domain-containing protein [Caballeronia sp. LP006]MDR5826888.1 NYN domain-containing protein [Caballeronia sp. LP006]
MPANQDSVSMALFCDFENVALGVRDAKYEKFDIKPVLERLLLKGSIVVKKAYCDWDRYKGFKSAMHEASFELIEIPHVRQSGKNSADIRLVVDALDLCYTKSHVDTFVIISGDSDFSPLVSKLRENAKKVIGVGVKNSTSDLLVANCDEFIFYDDLVREQQRALAKREANVATKRPADADRQPKQEPDARKSQAVAIAVETFEALVSERGEGEKIWASVLKSAIKRRKPGFSESHYGFRAFGNLLDEARSRGLLEVGRDDKSGSFVFRAAQTVSADAGQGEAVAASLAEPQGNQRRRDKRGGRKDKQHAVAEAVQTSADDDTFEVVDEFTEHTREDAQYPAQESADNDALAIADEPSGHHSRGRGRRNDRRGSQRPAPEFARALADDDTFEVAGHAVVPGDHDSREDASERLQASPDNDASALADEPTGYPRGRGKRNGRRDAQRRASSDNDASEVTDEPAAPINQEPTAASHTEKKPSASRRGGRKTAAKKAAAESASASSDTGVFVQPGDATDIPKPAKKARKTTSRTSRSRKATTPTDEQ